MNAKLRSGLPILAFCFLPLLMASSLGAKEVVRQDQGTAGIRFNTATRGSYAAPTGDSSWIATGPASVEMDGSVNFQYLDLIVSILPFISSYGGISFDKNPQNTTQTPSITWKVGGLEKWSTGMDIQNNDLYLAFDWSIPGDIFRVSPGAKFVLGPGIGCPAEEEAQFTIVSNICGGSADSGLEPLGLRSYDNDLRGAYILNWSDGDAAGARLKIASNSVNGSLDLVTYGASHATKAHRAWIGTTGPMSLRLGSNNQEQMVFFQNQINIGPKMLSGGGFSTCLNQAPSDDSLGAGECMWYFDPTPGAAKVMFKAKDSNGAVVRGSLPLN